MATQDGWQLIATTCDDTNCPKVWRHRETGALRIRGTDTDAPSRERDIEIGPADATLILRQLRG